MVTGLIFITFGVGLFFGLRAYNKKRYEDKMDSPPTPLKLGKVVPADPACVALRNKMKAEGRTPIV